MKLNFIILLLFGAIKGLSQTAFDPHQKPDMLIENLKNHKFASVESLDSVQIALNEKEGISQKMKAEAMYIIGKKYFSFGAFEKSVATLTQNIPLLRETKSFKEEADSYHFLGLNTGKLKQVEKAKYYYQKCIETAEVHQDTFNTINGLHGLGKLLLRENKLQDAKTTLLKARDLGIQSRDSLSLSYSLDFLSQQSAAAGEKQNALNLQLEALALRERLPDKLAFAISLTNVGESHELLKEDNKAEQYYENALEVSKDIGFNDLSLHLFGKLAQLEERKGNYKKAYTYLSFQKVLSDSLFNNTMSEKVAEAEGKFQLAEKERIIATEKTKSQQKSIVILLITLGFLAALSLSYAFYKKRQQEKVKSEIIAKEKLEKERIRIARDLHDNLGPELSLVTSRLDILAYKNESPEELEKLSDITRNAIDELKDTIWSIQYEALTLEDFAEKIRKYGRRRLEGLSTQFILEKDIPREIKLGPIQAIGYYRVVQEAINNAAKHAKADRILVKINANANSKDAAQIIVKDNGRGLKEETRGNGFGLNNMTARVKELGGNLEIISTKDKGLELVIDFHGYKVT